MSTQSIQYCTTDILPCETCLPSNVVFCIPNVLTADGTGFIDASLISFLKTSYCGVSKRQYTFEYDDAQLEDPNTPLLPCEISSVFCLDCKFAYLQSIAAGFLIGWSTDAEGNFIQNNEYSGDLIYNHEFLVRSNDDSGGINICGGSTNSTSTGGILQLQGVDAGGGVFLFGSFAAGGSIHLVQGAPNTFVSIDNYQQLRLWDFASNGDFEGNVTRGGDVIINATAKTLKLKSVANGAAGTFTANGSTAVVVSNTYASVNMVVACSLKTVGGTPAGTPFISAITAGTSFSMKSFVGDTSIYNYAILGLV